MYLYDINDMWIPIRPFSEALKAALKLTSEGAGKPRPGWIWMGKDGKRQPKKKKNLVDFGGKISEVLITSSKLSESELPGLYQEASKKRRIWLVQVAVTRAMLVA